MHLILALSPPPPPPGGPASSYLLHTCQRHQPSFRWALLNLSLFDAAVVTFAQGPELMTRTNLFSSLTSSNHAASVAANKANAEAAGPPITSFLKPHLTAAFVDDFTLHDIYLMREAPSHVSSPQIWTLPSSACLKALNLIMPLLFCYMMCVF